MTSRFVGIAWETIARDFLLRRGLEILRHGYRCRLGELDLVCRDVDSLVIVEVRARKRGSVTSALESISLHKQRKIIRATRHFLMNNPSWNRGRVRFDVVTIEDSDTSEPRVEWRRDAFSAD